MQIIFMYANTKRSIKKNERKKAVKEALNKFVHDIDYGLMHLGQYRRYIATAYVVIMALLPETVLAATGAAGGMSIVVLMQKASFWIGLGVAIWGVVEMQLDLPNWKGRIFKGILGYIFILILPLVFLELRDNLQVDVWQQIGTK